MLNHNSSKVIILAIIIKFNEIDDVNNYLEQSINVLQHILTNVIIFSCLKSQKILNFALFNVSENDINDIKSSFFTKISSNHVKFTIVKMVEDCLAAIE